MECKGPIEKERANIQQVENSKRVSIDEVLRESMAWPVLRGDRSKAVDLRGVAVPLSGFGINAGSVVRALWLFNALIGVQTLLDLSVIFGGTALPEGMSYAEYAHRGAYPLLVMAILAGAFALAATPFLGENRVMRPLLFLWLGQNIVVCGSALMRLELYVDVYGLTYLRIYAQIWMCLVAAGLALTVWQVHSGYPTTWLVRKCSILTCAVLYGTCFVNFAQVIVDHNMALAEPDFYYLCGLDPVGGMHRHAADVAAKGYESYCDLRVPQVRYWQEWGFRTWRALP